MKDYFTAAVLFRRGLISDFRSLTSDFLAADPLAYGVGEGEADSVADGDSSAAAFFFALFFGDAVGEGDSSVVAVFFAVDVFFLAVVPA
jgi:hypothetical protein